MEGGFTSLKLLGKLWMDFFLLLFAILEVAPLVVECMTRFFKISYLFFLFLCVCMCLPWQVCEGQRITMESGFSFHLCGLQGPNSDHVFVCVSICTWMWVTAEARGVRSPGARVARVIGYLMWVQGAKLRPSTRAVCTGDWLFSGWMRTAAAIFSHQAICASYYLWSTSDRITGNNYSCPWKANCFVWIYWLLLSDRLNSPIYNFILEFCSWCLWWLQESLSQL